ncbi:PAAR domain-containing protein [Burkholderia sp. Ac-20384]|uniref:PAAR domain-containing protein n=1 Tax=Burkholderia sp. Ac-20384 TaxID=2703902 RepID=UPI00197D517F|nr:PAAR domain-containing protein [Burkholderia sp. Ac-20384]MBN3828017.1 PAAR domain-containing protein [Burkholderia sp. Ac-20384]
MMRRIAVAGDELETGGRILAYAGPTFTFGNADHQAALIGGLAFCDACQSTGPIAKVGGLRRIEFMGEVAVDGDVVLCKCPTPPRIVAMLASDAWCGDSADEMDTAAPGASRTGGVAPPSSGAYDESVRAVGSGASNGYPYVIETPDGRIHSGQLDDSGYLPRIHTANESEYTVLWGDEALARRDKDV